MARTKTKERATPKVDVEMGATGGPTPPSKLTVTLLGVSILAALWAAMMLVPAGRVAYVYIFSYLEYYMGVLSLVSLSITIMVGLLSTDRLVLSIRLRLMLQSTHRTTGVMAVSALGVHLWTKFAEGHIRLIDMFIPGLYPGFNKVWVAFGTMSGIIMVFTMWTGIIRARFIGRGKPWMWRALHSVSYLMWPIAILHGLNAGRPGAVYVIVGYVLCVLLVVIGLAVRLAVSLNRRKDFASQQGTAGGGGNTGGMSPVGKMASGGKGRNRARGGMDDALVSDRGNAVQAWKPAAPPKPAAAPPVPAAELAPPAPAAPAPVSPAVAPVAEEREDTQTRMRRPRRDEDERYDTQTRMSRRELEQTGRWELEDDDEPIRRPRRRVEEDLPPAPRQRRGEDFDEPTTAISRRALDDGLRRYDDEDDLPPRRRRADEDERYDTQTRMRRPARYADEEDVPPRRRVDDDERYDTQTRMRRPARYADEDDAAMPAPRTTRRALPSAEENLPAPRGRRAAMDDDVREDTQTRMSRRALLDDDPREDTQTRMSRRALLDDEDREDTQTRMRRSRYADEEPPAPRQRRYADEYAEDERYDTQTRMRRPARYADEEPPAPRRRSSRYAEEGEEVPRGRRDRGTDVDRADSGRHSRSEFVDLAADVDPADDDDTPTIVDMAQRRARRAEQQEPVRSGTGRGARRGSRGATAEEADDAGYWATLRGEAQ
ncbi:translation initiation factor III [Actinoplanes sp. RD1]|uniref:translation initiation factor III n=1 Tax=Actinoplanes sp. RD1 TaxID=3064538 RepID=UPI0027404E79|nr:translation initiation factor III [Actinoplanes sp. RD1]